MNDQNPNGQNTFVSGTPLDGPAPAAPSMMPPAAPASAPLDLNSLYGPSTTPIAPVAPAPEPMAPPPPPPPMNNPFAAPIAQPPVSPFSNTSVPSSNLPADGLTVDSTPPPAPDLSQPPISPFGTPVGVPPTPAPISNPYLNQTPTSFGTPASTNPYAGSVPTTGTSGFDTQNSPTPDAMAGGTPSFANSLDQNINAAQPSSGFNWSNTQAPVAAPPPPAPVATPEPPAPTFTTQDLYGPSTTPAVDPNATPNPSFQPQEMGTPPSSGEPAPTDLSQLIASQQSDPAAPVYNPPLSQPETLVTPPGQEVSTGGPTIASSTPAKSGGGIPKWVIGLGVGLLIMVAAASAYFILGVGKAPAPESVPATGQQTQITPPITTPVPVATQTTILTTPVASESAGFGNVESTASAQATGSAIQRLKSRAAATPKP